MLSDHEAEFYFKKNDKFIKSKVRYINNRYINTFRFDAESIVMEAFNNFCKIFNPEKGKDTTCLSRCIDLLVKKEMKYKSFKKNQCVFTDNVTIYDDNQEKDIDFIDKRDILSEVFKEEVNQELWRKIDKCSERAKIIFLILMENPEIVAGKGMCLLGMKGKLREMTRNLKNELAKWDEFQNISYEGGYRLSIIELRKALYC